MKRIFRILQVTLFFIAHFLMLAVIIDNLKISFYAQNIQAFMGWISCAIWFGISTLQSVVSIVLHTKYFKKTEDLPLQITLEDDII